MTGFLILIGMLVSVSYWLWIQLRETKQEIIGLIDEKIKHHGEWILDYTNSAHDKVDALKRDKAKIWVEIKAMQAALQKISSPSQVKASPHQAKTSRASKGSGK